jgi:septal ring factor EnvC (AmiA/AmiB activator)
MSASLASAKRRRALNEPVNPNKILDKTQPPATCSLATGKCNTPDARQPQIMKSVPPLIQNIENRIQSLEKQIKETSTTISLEDIIEEFDKRYEMLAEEIINIKNTVMQLQTYTMDVNKQLYEKSNKVTLDQDSPSSNN